MATIITLEAFKEYLGIDSSDVTQDALLNKSLVQAQALVEGYIGMPLAVTEHEYELFDTEHRHWLYLPYRPIHRDGVVVEKDGSPVPEEQYQVSRRDGALVFDGHRNFASYGCREIWAKHVLVKYKAGWETLPADLLDALLNMSAGIKDLGGDFSSSTGAATGALKSLTMFDAMSMSFETGGDTTSMSGGPEGVLAAWKFVLDQYRVLGQPVLA